MLAGALLCLAPSRIGLTVGAALLALAAIWLTFLLIRARQARLAYDDGQLLVYLRGLNPIRIPIEVVECFFLGQGASLLPPSLHGKHGEGAETATVVVRLAEAAREWSHVDVWPSFGLWCEGYITIRGTWCEPLDGELIAGLNRRLVAVHRAQKQVLEEAVQA
jgi:hypothetical protein